ncbi:YbaK/EbsC family protein [Nocardioides sp. B-3]|uniref:YbaK/EbsC family protein n=1 Tax=Nocardioides sp. B-3 TaxID=2895565 RepID=UPI00215264A0|nr:YbaK/EbsC family protein [Nocardioides sp. B-3]UUZ59667.1 YbaK/EbsC family protein [Nocardioides sp. B-3]
MASEHPAIRSFRDDLHRRGGTGDVVILPDSVHTAVLAAEAPGCEVGAIANSLLFDSGGSPVLILTSGAHRVDTAKVAEHIGVAKLTRATPEFVRQHTGQVIGGVSPIDHPAPVPTGSIRGCATTRSCGPPPATPPPSSPRPSTSS